MIGRERVFGKMLETNALKTNGGGSGKDPHFTQKEYPAKDCVHH